MSADDGDVVPVRFDDTDWQEALHATSSFIRAVMKSNNLDVAIQALWGRSLRNGKAPSSPASTTTIQMHCTVDKDKLHQVLKAPSPRL